MNKALILTIFVSLTLLLPVNAVINEMGNLIDAGYAYAQITTVKYEPYPAAPGRYVDVWIKVLNSGYDEEDIEFKLLPKYPFSIDSGEKAERSASKLESGGTALFHYVVRVAEDAIEGNNAIPYEVRIDGRRETSTINIWVQTIDATISVNAVTTQKIVPGEASPVEIEVENAGDSPISDINIKLDLSATTTPLIPVNSTNEKKIYMLGAKTKQTVTFNIMALPGAASNAYKIPIEIKYVDLTGKNYTKEGIIGLIVGAQPDLFSTIASSGIYSTGETGEIAIRVTNKGLTDVKLLSANLISTEQYYVISENKLYLGNIDSDDYETAEYRIKAKKSEKGITTLKLELDYLDANNNKFTEVKDVPLKIVSEKDLGTGGNGSFIKILVLLFLMVAAFFMYKRWEKSKLLKK
ncbi:COG1361 S-layer family protein [Candidatus Woesearchaeota archaeon]|nr:COG1361 S-layer family protein [Candidatus Woesearchaeota archaeon]